MDTPGQRQFVQFVEVGCLDELQLEAHALGEGRDQVMLESVVVASAPSWKKAGVSRTATTRVPSASGGSMRVQAARPNRARQQIRRSSFGNAFPPCDDRRFAGIIRASRRGGRVVECT